MQAALGKTSFHSLKGLIGRENHRFSFVTPVDDFVE